ncbi:MAG TPA: class I SAM-dependent methyltransferase, partial [Polyangiaceae bacterium]|nr:class I SAM-dependent methyltransferase [Polyangiaceae bacterium]
LAGALAGELGFVRAALWKPRTQGASRATRRPFEFVLGGEREVERRVSENGVRYALDLLMHQENTLYLDTRELRAWLKSELRGQSVLNAFAYTGSLGVAAAAGGASSVLSLDLRRRFLNVAKASYTLNGLLIRRADFVSGDFLLVSAALRRQKRLFHCVILDPPFFSSTAAGRVDLALQAERVLNKARPLVGHGGTLVFVNNALFVSGAEQLRILERACAGGYLEIERSLPVPADVIGLARQGAPAWPVDPAPFDYPTKISVLRVRRKDGRKADLELAGGSQ